MRDLMKQVLQETIDYYGADPSRRAITVDGVCSYSTGYGRYCAVGRCLTPSGLNKVTEGDPASMVLAYLPLNGVKKKYRPLIGYHGFWNALQMLHDDSCFWEEEGLSAEGKREVARISEKIGGGAFTKQ